MIRPERNDEYSSRSKVEGQWGWQSLTLRLRSDKERALTPLSAEVSYFLSVFFHFLRSHELRQSHFLSMLPSLRDSSL